MAEEPWAFYGHVGDLVVLGVISTSFTKAMEQNLSSWPSFASWFYLQRKNHGSSADFDAFEKNMPYAAVCGD
jgi:hypothetical protein